MQSQASFFEAARVALDSLRGSKLRSFLTLLGIILSTTTLISVMSVIHGMDVYIAESATTMGTEGFRVLRFAFVGNFDPKKFLEYQRKNPNLSPEEFDAIKNNLTHIKELGTTAGRGGKVSYDGDQVDIGVNGVTLRLKVKDVKEAGRATKGVHLIKPNEGDQVASVARISAEDLKKVGAQVADGAEAESQPTLV